MTDDELFAIRAEIGIAEPPDDGDLDEIFSRVGTVAGTASEVLKGRLAVFMAAPASFAVDGFSQNTSANIAALQKRIDSLEKQHLVQAAGPSSTTGTIQLCRLEPRR
jgi:hypothetical protein